jgi:hypothetical protein
MDSPNPVPPPIVAYKVLVQTLELARLPAGPGYKPPSRWYARMYPEEKPGVLAKAVKLVDRVRLVRITPEVVEAEVPSESDPGRVYRVRVYVDPLDFECECPHGEHRFNPCKHVLAVVLRLVRDYMTVAGRGAEVVIPALVHEGLSKLAYYKARNYSRYA